MAHTRLNIPLLTRIAVWLEAGAPEAEAKGMSFDMNRLLVVTTPDASKPDHWCGSACCVAGITLVFDAPDLVDASIRQRLTARAISTSDYLYAVNMLTNGVHTMAEAAHRLGLTKAQADDLFVPWHHYQHVDLGEDDQPRWMSSVPSDFTAAWTARTIRHLIATGTVDWKATAEPTTGADHGL